jgi:hypothetical protein
MCCFVCLWPLQKLICRGIPKDKAKIVDQLKEVIAMTSSGDLIAEVAKVALLSAQNVDLARECAERYQIKFQVIYGNKHIKFSQVTKYKQ